jgi:hypothetical protein
MTANGIVTSACHLDLASRRMNEEPVPERNMTTAFVVNFPTSQCLMHLSSPVRANSFGAIEVLPLGIV